IFALCLLESILTDTDASPLTLALLKSGLCTQVESSIDVEMSEIPWTIVCKGCENSNAEALKKVLFAALQEFVDQPIPPEEIEASIHQLEFQRTEIGAEGVPFGLSLFMRAALIKQHGSNPEDALLIHSLFDELRNRIKNPDYLPNLLRKYLIDNPHFVQLTMTPDPKLEKEEREEETSRLKAIRARLTPSDEEQILIQTRDLEAYQEAAERQSLECLPKVTLRDVPPHARDFPLVESKEKNLTVFHHDCFTNQILYADLVFDLPEIPAKDLPLLSLFTRLLSELGCGGRTYAETLAYQQAYIGGFDASLALHLTQADPDIARPTFSLRGKALYRNSPKLFQLFIDFISSIDLTDRERIREWLMQHATELQNRLTKSSMNYAVQTSLSGFSKASFISNQWTGLPYYKAVLSWTQNFDDHFLNALQQIK
ncbi:MAG: insulinase family protein, partial [Chlamydiota bacterium]